MAAQIQPFETPDVNPSEFCLWVGWRIKYKQERWTHETNSSLSFWMLLPAKKHARTSTQYSTGSSHTIYKMQWGWEVLALFWVVTQRVVAISYRRFRITNRSQLQWSWRWDRQVVPKRRYEIATARCVTTQKRAAVIYFAAEAWNTHWGWRWDFQTFIVNCKNKF